MASTAWVHSLKSMDMDMVTSFAVLLPVLAGLALIDSLSFGTLAIPVWLLMAPGKVRLGPVLLYLATIGGFYFLVGLALLFGARFVSVRLEIDWNHPSVMLAGFAVGLGLLVLSFVLEPPKALQRTRQTDAKPSGIYARLAAWRQSAVDGTVADGDTLTAIKQPTKRRTASLVGIAVTAGVLELATMLPYLAAIGLLTASTPALGLGAVQSAGLLAAYCVVMVLPALALLLGRTVLRTTVAPVLERIDAWFAKNGQSTMAWVVGIVGVVLMLNTVDAVTDVFV